MRLAFVPASLILALAAAAVACAPGAAEPGDSSEVPDAPDVEQPAADPWIADVYEPVMKEAAQIDVGEFLETYAGPEYIEKLSYDPTTAAGLAEIRNYAGLGPEHDKLLAQNGFVAVGDSPTYTFASRSEE